MAGWSSDNLLGQSVASHLPRRTLRSKLACSHASFASAHDDHCARQDATRHQDWTLSWRWLMFCHLNMRALSARPAVHCWRTHTELHRHVQAQDWARDMAPEHMLACKRAATLTQPLQEGQATAWRKTLMACMQRLQHVRTHATALWLCQIWLCGSVWEHCCTSSCSKDTELQLALLRQKGVGTRAAALLLYRKYLWASDLGKVEQ